MFLKENNVMKHDTGETLLRRKPWMIGLILFLIVTSGIPRLAQEEENPFSPRLDGTWWYVGGSGPNNYTKIQDAIDNASDGDTVFVFNGTYIGYVIINKAIHLLGEDKYTTNIIGYFAYTLSIIADSVYMSGFTIQYDRCQGEGVRIDSSYNTFTNNIIDIPNDRVRVFGHNNTISNNIIKNTYLYITSDDNIISGNSFMNFYHDSIINDYYGIYLMDCWDTIISNNSFVNSGVFISLENICNNFVTNNVVNGKPLLYRSGESNLVLDDDAGQIILVNCSNITVKNQEISNTTVGIQIAESKSCLLTSNIITGDHYGICITGRDNIVRNNDITNNQYGIEVSGENNTLKENTISNNHLSIYLDDASDNNTISENTIGNNHNSVLLDYGSDFNKILNNTITHNKDAIHISGDSNTISGNTIAYNNDFGIFLNYCDSNIISNNSLTNNDGVGLFLSRCNHNNIITNTITGNNFSGISLIGNNNTLSKNLITYNRFDGIELDGNNNTIETNTIANNPENGIQLHNGINNNISGNTFTYNTNGIDLLRGGYNRITDNTIALNTESGITLNCSRNNIISYNALSKNKKGISLILSTNNTILTNNFLKNTRHAHFVNCTNNWDQNYWGRPRLLPKLIFGTPNAQDQWPPLFDIDWHPTLRPYTISESTRNISEMTDQNLFR